MIFPLVWQREKHFNNSISGVQTSTWGSHPKFQNFFGHGSIKVADCKKNIKKFELWDAPGCQQLYQKTTINNRYPSIEWIERERESAISCTAAATSAARCLCKNSILSVVIVAATAILKDKMKLQSSCCSNFQDLLTSIANDELLWVIMAISCRIVTSLLQLQLLKKLKSMQM